MTLAEPHSSETEVKKSRFVTHAWPCSSADEALDLIASRRDPSATHNCWAYLASGGIAGTGKRSSHSTRQRRLHPYAVQPASLGLQACTCHKKPASPRIKLPALLVCRWGSSTAAAMTASRAAQRGAPSWRPSRARGWTESRCWSSGGALGVRRHCGMQLHAEGRV